MRMAMLSLLLFAGPLLAQTETTPPPISVETKVKANTAFLVATTEGKTVAWILPKDSPLYPSIPVEFLRDTKAIAYSGPAGTYRVVAATSLKDLVVWEEVMFTLGGVPIPPPPPLPPAPEDDLPRRFKDAYNAEANVSKKGQIINLIGVYSAATKVADDQTLQTTSALLGELTKIRDELVGKDNPVLADLRRIASAEVVGALGLPSMTPMTAETRQKAAAVFSRIAEALKKVQ